MAKKKNVNVDAEVGDAKIHVEKANGKITVEYDGKERDFKYTKEELEKYLRYDGKKVDVEIIKNEEGTKVEIKTENGFLRTVVKILTRLVFKKKL